MFSMEVLVNALVVGFVAQLFAGAAWLFKLGGRVASLEAKMSVAETAAVQMAVRMGEVEKTQGVHTTDLAVIKAGVENIEKTQGKMLDLLQRR